MGAQPTNRTTVLLFILFFMFCILNTHIVNRIAVSLFIGQGWRATSPLSPSDGQEANAKGVAFSSDKWLP